jgi:hypothetical protein
MRTLIAYATSSGRWRWLLTVLAVLVVAAQVTSSTRAAELRPLSRPSPVESFSPRPSDKLSYSPDGRWVLVGDDCVDPDSPHEQAECRWTLVQVEDAARSTWRVPGVSASWSQNASTFVISTKDRGVLIGEARSGDVPRLIPVDAGLITPSVSPSGLRLAAQVVGAQDDLMSAIQESPGLVVLDLKSGRSEVLPAQNGDTFSPFFISETVLGYGDVVSDGGVGRVALFSHDLSTGERSQLTNMDPTRITSVMSEPPLVLEDGRLIYDSDDSIDQALPSIYELHMATRVIRKIGEGRHLVFQDGRVRALQSAERSR